jgi:hypothetical protein
MGKNFVPSTNVFFYRMERKEGEKLQTSLTIADPSKWRKIAKEFWIKNKVPIGLLVLGLHFFFTFSPGSTLFPYF